MDLDPMLSAVSAEAAEIAEALHTLHQRQERLQFKIEECMENKLWSLSEKYPIPDHDAWALLITGTSHWSDYCEAFPRKPERPCIYHPQDGRQRCKDFKHSPWGTIFDLPQGRSWLVGRNHIWKACDKCLQRTSLADSVASERSARRARRRARNQASQASELSQASWAPSAN